MLPFIYNLSIYLYKSTISFASLFNKKAKQKVQGLGDSKKAIDNLKSMSAENRVLVHCSSQGEHEQALPIIRWILKNTNYVIVLSFYSPSGYTHSKYDNNDRIIKAYLPFDLTSEISKFISSISPRFVIIIKNEWWWNLLHELKHQSIPSFLISSTFRKQHYFLKYPFDFFRQGLNAFNAIFVVDQDSYQNISEVYKGQVVDAGDTRIDQANYNKKKAEQEHLIQDTIQNRTERYCIVYGSIWESDIDSINMLIQQFPEADHLIYPHEISEHGIVGIKERILNSKIISKTKEISNGIHIITSMGELKYAYRLADLAYIGGGFGSGIHNVLEAAVYNIPTLFGPNYLKSNEAIDLIAKECSFNFKNRNDFKLIYEKIQEEKNRIEIEMKLKSYFSPSNSPTEIICQEIFKKIDLHV